MIRRHFAAAIISICAASPAFAARCGGDFNAFLAQVSRDAAAAGIAPGIIDTALAGVTPDPAVLAFDRRQHGTFRISFERYAATRVTPGRVARARQLLKRHAALLSRIERQFGVPGPVIVAIWTLETDNGGGTWAVALPGDRAPRKQASLTARTYSRWVAAPKLRTVMSSIMQARNGPGLPSKV